MAEVDQGFLAEMLRGIRADLADIRERMARMELRQTATEHFEQGIMHHIASIHSSIDELKSDVRLIKRRLDLVEAE